MVGREAWGTWRGMRGVGCVLTTHHPTPSSLHTILYVASRQVKPTVVWTICAVLVVSEMGSRHWSTPPVCRKTNTYCLYCTVCVLTVSLVQRDRIAMTPTVCDWRGEVRCEGAGMLRTAVCAYVTLCDI